MNKKIRAARRMLDSGQSLPDGLVDDILRGDTPKKQPRKQKMSRKQKRAYKSKQQISDRFVKGLRRKITKHERLLKEALDSEHVIFSFQQKFIGKGAFYIVDFYFKLVSGDKLVVEIDGDSHLRKEQIEKDIKRDAYFESRGMMVLRFTNTEVEDDVYAVMDAILEFNPKCSDNML